MAERMTTSTEKKEIETHVDELEGPADKAKDPKMECTKTADESISDLTPAPKGHSHEVEVEHPDNAIKDNEKAFDGQKRAEEGKTNDVPDEEPESSRGNLDSETKDDHDDVNTPAEKQEEKEEEKASPETAKSDVPEDKAKESQVENVETGNEANSDPTPTTERSHVEETPDKPIQENEKVQDGPQITDKQAKDVPEEKEVRSPLKNSDIEKEAKDGHQHDPQGSSLVTRSGEITKPLVSPIEKKEEDEIKDADPGTTDPLVLEDEKKGDSSEYKGAAILQIDVEDNKGRPNTSPNEETPLLPSGKPNTGRHPSKHIKERKLVAIVIGATGSGKSATANTLLGQNIFKDASGAVTPETSVKKHTISLDDMDFSSSIMYPHLTQDRLKELKDVGATEEQLQKADDKAKGEIEKRLTGYGHCVDNFPDEGPIYTSLKVIDTPGSWNLKGIGSCNTAVIYIIVINLASPRFKMEHLDIVQSLRGWGCENIVESEKTLVILTHAESALGNGKTLQDYVKEIKGDPLHTFLTNDIGKHRYIAVNNSSMSEYETNIQRQSLLLKMETYSSSCECCSCCTLL